MSTYISLATSLAVGLLTRSVVGAEAAFKPPINNTLESGVETECKTCPYSLCTNKAFYEYDTQVTLLCWTRGTEIGGDTYVYFAVRVDLGGELVLTGNLSGLG